MLNRLKVCSSISVNDQSINQSFLSQTVLVYLQPLWRNRPEKLLNSEITQNNAPYAVQGHKVADFGIYRKPICNFLLVIYTNLHHISHRFRVIADYWLSRYPSCWISSTVFFFHFYLLMAYVISLDYISAVTSGWSRSNLLTPQTSSGTVRLLGRQGPWLRARKDRSAQLEVMSSVRDPGR